METKEQLKSVVKELAAESHRIRVERIRPTKGPDRAAAWWAKRAVGRRARATLLAYAFVRGIPYRCVEPKTHEDTFEFEASRRFARQSLASEVVRALSEAGVESDREVICAWMSEGGK